ncbi:MAG: efflux RND transporter periplasmic adaptor subunit, partial [Gemmatimonadota bacterium]|nr:efflux RND transporter periplasmic adaptor subunit [Gemmatimonadota bacterium]
MKHAWLAVVCAAALAACSNDAPGTPAEAQTRGPAADAPPDVVLADTATVAVPLSIPAQLYVEHDAVIHARSSGVVEALRADLGMQVREGQLLAQLESRDQQLALERAQEAFDASRREVERQRILTNVSGGTVADSERVESAHRRAALAVREAERAMELTRVTAPFTGVVTARYARAERLVQEGDSLFRVTARTPLLAAIHVPESLAAGLRVGTTARVVG